MIPPDHRPQCAGCGQPIDTFEQWFVEPCPADMLGGHQLEREEWVALLSAPRPLAGPT